MNFPMKKYLMITYALYHMGGGQLYALRRARYLKKKGYDVYIISARAKEKEEDFILKKEFSEFKFTDIPEVSIPYAFFSPQKRERIIRKIKKFIGYGDFIIESHLLSAVEWGEILAYKIGAKHIAHTLDDRSLKEFKYKPGIDIFKKKLMLNEFYGCGSTSIENIFEDASYKDNYVNVGFSASELKEVSKPQISVEKNNEYLITTISRLEKPYIYQIIEDSIKLAIKYPERKFKLLIVGDSQIEDVTAYLKEKAAQLSKNVNNIEIIFTGFIKELGKDIFKITDLYICQGTSVINAISQGTVTLNVISFSLKDVPINSITIEELKNLDKRIKTISSGFFGTDTKNFAFSENNKYFTLFEKMEEAYLASPNKINNLKQNGLKVFNDEFELTRNFEKLDEIINNLNIVDREYKISNPIYVLYKRIQGKLKKLFKI